jgi:RNA polymerase sigma-70 factor (ECF subfamily)
MVDQPGPDTAVEHLMNLYAGGDPLAFRRLFDRLAPWLRAFFRRSFSDAAIADDLTQATFLRLHGARASYQSGRPLKPWLFSIAASVRRDELRRRGHQPRQVDVDALPSEQAEDALATVDEVGADAAAPRALAAPAANDASEAVREAIRALPASQRVVIQLHQFEGLTFEQIAKQLNTTPGAVRVRASRAYEQLRLELRSFLKRSRAT